MTANLVLERDLAGKPHAGKVLAAIQPHSDDIPIFAAGTTAKLLREGYTGYLIRMTNDDMAGPGTIGDTVLANEKDNDAVARVLGLKQVFNLNYANHQMDKESRLARISHQPPNDAKIDQKYEPNRPALRENRSPSPKMKNRETIAVWPVYLLLDLRA